MADLSSLKDLGTAVRSFCSGSRPQGRFAWPFLRDRQAQERCCPRLGQAGLRQDRRQRQGIRGILRTPGSADDPAPADRCGCPRRPVRHHRNGCRRRSFRPGRCRSSRHLQGLTYFEPGLRPVLKKGGFLTRDSRVVERKKYGRPRPAVRSSSRSVNRFGLSECGKAGFSPGLFRLTNGVVIMPAPADGPFVLKEIQSVICAGETALDTILKLHGDRLMPRDIYGRHVILLLRLKNCLESLWFPARMKNFNEADQVFKAGSATVAQASKTAGIPDFQASGTETALSNAGLNYNPFSI
jgi:hypothetical protein